MKCPYYIKKKTCGGNFLCLECDRLGNLKSIAREDLLKEMIELGIIKDKLLKKRIGENYEEVFASSNTDKHPWHQ